eukprot:9214475-Alexandrium_andersonii.AAC.1
MQLLADVACTSLDCLRVGEIGVIKCSACGSTRQGIYEPEFFRRIKQNRLARWIVKYRERVAQAVPRLLPPPSAGP